jgi:tetratricopeptide (TPR) repeat protein
VRFKNWLPSKIKKEEVERQLTVDELMAVDRHEEAKAQLMAKLRTNPNDLHAHLKLGDAYRHLGQNESCQSEYLFVAKAYAEDGFYDRARAVLTKVSRFFPGEIDVETQMMALQRAKNLEYSRDRARAGLLAHRRLSDTMTGVKAVEFERVWNSLSRTSLVDRISSTDLTLLFESVEIRRAPPDTIVAEPAEGSELAGRALFLIVSGRIEARALDANEHLVTVRSFGPGEIVGASVLFGGRPWPAQYRCSEHTTYLELDGRGLARLGRELETSGLLGVLREQDNDRIVRRAVEHLQR